tara:strand:- start:573 stop:719 length:147 start_codon:yes stop_codon:yes gene_type:complete
MSRMTNPYMDCGEHLPEIIPFIVDVSYVPEGENDSVQVRIQGIDITVL